MVVIKNNLAKMKKLNDVLIEIWSKTTGTQERDYLRALHEKANLQALARELNRFTLNSGVALKLSSLWVDWQPQSWKWIQSRKIFDKPSVELADLVVVVWNDSHQKNGTALILAAKMSTVPDMFSLSGKSTKKEITFLESPYKFMLSNNMSGVPKPLPGFTQSQCEFNFSANLGFNYWRWMIIRRHNSTAWSSKTLRYTVKKNSINKSISSLSNSLVEMIAKPSLGRFSTNCFKCEWCRFINVLLGHTATIAHHPKAHGPARVETFVSRFVSASNPSFPQNCSFISLNLAACLPVDVIDDADHPVVEILSGNGGDDVSGRFDNFEESPHPQCSILFITKSEVPSYCK